MSCSADTASTIRSKLAGVFLHLLRVFRNHNFIGAEAEPVLDLARRSREQHHVRAQRMRELHAHMAQAANPTIPTFLPGPAFQ